MTELHEDPTMIVRSFSAEITPGEGRTADVRIVPFGVEGMADDGLGGLPRGVVYRETWMPGAFNHQLSAANHVTANVEHEQGIGGIVARGLALREGRDGYYGSFKFLDTPNGNTALELVKEGTFPHVSLEARPVKSQRGANGVVQRTKANLVGIAFCRVPAFAGADVLSLREGQLPENEIVYDEELMLPAMDPELLKRAASLGIALPDGLRAQYEASELLLRAFTTEAWDGSSSRYKDAAAYCEACVIDVNPSGKPKEVQLCHLPVKEPNGDYNVNAIRDALSRLDEVKGVSDSTKAEAKTRLEGLLAQANKSK